MESKVIDQRSNEKSWKRSKSLRAFVKSFLLIFQTRFGRSLFISEKMKKIKDHECGQLSWYFLQIILLLSTGKFHYFEINIDFCHHLFFLCWNVNPLNGIMRLLLPFGLFLSHNHSSRYECAAYIILSELDEKWSDECTNIYRVMRIFQFYASSKNYFTFCIVFMEKCRNLSAFVMEKLECLFVWKQWTRLTTTRTQKLPFGELKKTKQENGIAALTPRHSQLSFSKTTMTEQRKANISLATESNATCSQAHADWSQKQNKFSVLTFHIDVCVNDSESISMFSHQKKANFCSFSLVWARIFLSHGRKTWFDFTRNNNNQREKHAEGMKCIDID